MTPGLERSKFTVRRGGSEYPYYYNTRSFGGYFHKYLYRAVLKYGRRPAPGYYHRSTSGMPSQAADIRDGELEYRVSAKTVSERLQA
jgi:hypothetical protein